VRILRAIKFAARLDLGIAADVYDAMVIHREALAKAARPRLFEEVLRLLRGGAAHRSMWLLWEVGAMSLLIPELSAYIDDDEATDGGGERFWRRMDAIDQRTKELGAPLSDIVLFTTLLREPLDEACAGAADPAAAADEFLEPIIERIAMPRRIADAIRRIVLMQPRLAQGRVGRLARSELIGAAIDVLEIDRIAAGKSTAGLKEMRAAVPAVEPAPARGNGAGPRRRGPRRTPR